LVHCHVITSLNDGYLAKRYLLSSPAFKEPFRFYSSYAIKMFGFGGCQVWGVRSVTRVTLSEFIFLFVFY